MTLGQKQRAFTLNVAKLITWAYENGYELTFGDAYRSPEMAALNEQNGIGIKNSLHTKRLAIDLNLFVDGKYMAQSEAYLPLGEYWEKMNPEHRWGGRFKRADGNHFSCTFEGVS